jgi:thiopurine S-methyltransferase
LRGLVLGRCPCFVGADRLRDSRWSAGQIGFHEGEANQHLQAHASALGSGKRVLVPLCGKAEDLTYLAARGHQVVGVELVESAVSAFFEEHGAKPKIEQVGAFKRYSAPGVTIFVGDFFATTRELLGPVDALYDRAAIIALPEAMRVRYAKHVRTLMPVGAPGLIITVEYPQDQMSGPPFSVPEAELRAHYAGLKLERVAEVKANLQRLLGVGSEKCFVATF